MSDTEERRKGRKLWEFHRDGSSLLVPGEVLGVPESEPKQYPGKEVEGSSPPLPEDGTITGLKDTKTACRTLSKKMQFRGREPFRLPRADVVEDH